MFVSSRAARFVGVLLFVLLLAGTAEAAEVGQAPVLEQCPMAIGLYVHSYYGMGWLMQCEEGIAFVVPSRYHRWAILYTAGAEISGQPTRNPAWVAELGK